MRGPLALMARYAAPSVPPGGDPEPSLLASGASTAQATEVTFPAQPAGTLLLLAIGGDDYRNGSPAGWTLSPGMAQEVYLGHYMWWKIANGSETSVTYTLNGPAASSYIAAAISNIDGASPLDTSAGQSTTNGGPAYQTPSSGATGVGQKIAVAGIGMADTGTNAATGMGSWLNSYTELADMTSGPVGAGSTIIGLATLLFDGGPSTSSGATATGGDGYVNSSSGHIAVFTAGA